MKRLFRIRSLGLGWIGPCEGLSVVTCGVGMSPIGAEPIVSRKILSGCGSNKKSK